MDKITKSFTCNHDPQHLIKKEIKPLGYNKDQYKSKDIIKDRNQLKHRIPSEDLEAKSKIQS